LFSVIKNDQDLVKFDFSKVTDSFVVKPNRGMGGKGIIVVEKQGKAKGTWITSERQKVTNEDVKLHIADILEGRFSMQDLPDIAYIEERVRIHPVFKDYSYHGTPDIGVVVFNRIPVMAFLRLPTKESGGRANMFQGAIACGIDLATGVTTYAYQKSDYITRFPGTRKELRGIHIPEWEAVLQLAVKAAEAAGLGYMRADIVLQPSLKKPGKIIPKVLELNAQPGLKIQLCNKDGLRRRLERVEGLEVDTVEKGIRIAQELFADRRMEGLGIKNKRIGVFEDVVVTDGWGKKVVIKAKVDTGADRTSIDAGLAEELGLLRSENVLYTVKVDNALGKKQERAVIGIGYTLGGRQIQSTASVSDRSHLKRPMLVGRRDLKGFVIGFD
jgi:alpha-L-glutamate ligase-like protein